MAKKLKAAQELKIERPKRVKLSEEETLKRMEAFDERKEQFIATVRKARIEIYEVNMKQGRYVHVVAI